MTEQHETEALAVTVDLLHSYDVNIAPETLAAELKEARIEG
jgi:hypothetical protein